MQQQTPTQRVLPSLDPPPTVRQQLEEYEHAFDSEYAQKFLALTEKKYSRELTSKYKSKQLSPKLQFLSLKPRAKRRIRNQTYFKDQTTLDRVSRLLETMNDKSIIKMRDASER